MAQNSFQHIPRLIPHLHALKSRHGTPNFWHLDHFGMALPIYTTQNKRFFSSWVRFQFLIGTPSFQLLGIILHDILTIKCDINRFRKSHHRLSKETDRHLGEMRKKDGRRNVTQCSVNNFKQLFSFACSTPAGLVFLLFIFLSHLFHFIDQILDCVTFKIVLFSI